MYTLVPDAATFKLQYGF